MTGYISTNAPMLNAIIIQLIRIYQLFLSPDHSFWARSLGKSHCRYYPTCSMYGKECFERFGFFRALWLTAKRVARCHPWAKGGLDPVPDLEPQKCNHKHSKK